MLCLNKVFGGLSMALLIAGVSLWALAHWFKRLAPQLRANMGDAGKGAVALTILGSVVLMILGYSHAEGAFYWGRSPAMVGINNLLVLLAVYLMVASSFGSWVTGIVAHPQLTAIKSWAVGHLLVNGDTPSFVLFGGLLAWAVISVILLNRNDGKPVRTVRTTAGREVITGVAAILVYGAIAFAHIYLGYPVFG